MTILQVEIKITPISIPFCLWSVPSELWVDPVLFGGGGKRLKLPFQITSENGRLSSDQSDMKTRRQKKTKQNKTKQKTCSQNRITVKPNVLLMATCKFPPRHWYFDWQFEWSKLQPARAGCTLLTKFIAQSSQFSRIEHETRANECNLTLSRWNYCFSRI